MTYSIGYGHNTWVYNIPFYGMDIPQFSWELNKSGIKIKKAVCVPVLIYISDLSSSWQLLNLFMGSLISSCRSQIFILFSSNEVLFKIAGQYMCRH